MTVTLKTYICAVLFLGSGISVHPAWAVDLEAQAIVKNILDNREKYPLAAQQLDFAKELQSRSAEDVGKLVAEIKRLNPSENTLKECLNKLKNEKEYSFELRSKDTSQCFSLKDLIISQCVIIGDLKLFDSAETFLSKNLEELLLIAQSYSSNTELILHDQGYTNLFGDNVWHKAIQAPEDISGLRMALVLLCSVAKNVPITALDVLGKDWFNTSPTTFVIPIPEEALHQEEVKTMFQNSRLGVTKKDAKGQNHYGILNFNLFYETDGEVTWHPEIPINPYIYDKKTYLNKAFSGLNADPFWLSLNSCKFSKDISINADPLWSSMNSNKYFENDELEEIKKNNQLFKKDWKIVDANSLKPGDLLLECSFDSKTECDQINSDFSIVLGVEMRKNMKTPKLLQLSYSSLGLVLEWKCHHLSDSEYRKVFLRPRTISSTLPPTNVSLNTKEEESKEEESKGKAFKSQGLVGFKRQADASTQTLDENVLKDTHESQGKIQPRKRTKSIN